MLWSANRLMQVYGGVCLEKWKYVDTLHRAINFRSNPRSFFFCRVVLIWPTKGGRGGALPCPHLLFVSDEGAQDPHTVFHTDPDSVGPKLRFGTSNRAGLHCVLSGPGFTLRMRGWEQWILWRAFVYSWISSCVMAAKGMGGWSYICNVPSFFVDVFISKSNVLLCRDIFWYLISENMNANGSLMHCV